MSVFFIIIITIYWAAIWGVNVNFSDFTSPEYVPMFEWTFPSLSGMLALGLFIHNAIITITKNHEHPEKNVSCILSIFSSTVMTNIITIFLFHITITYYNFFNRHFAFLPPFQWLSQRIFLSAYSTTLHFPYQNGVSRT